MAKMSMRERVARMICEERGGKPDEPTTVGLPPIEHVNEDGSTHIEHREPVRHAVAWKAYSDLADRIIKAVKSG